MNKSLTSAEESKKEKDEVEITNCVDKGRNVYEVSKENTEIDTQINLKINSSAYETEAEAALKGSMLNLLPKMKKILKIWNNIERWSNIWCVNFVEATEERGCLRCNSSVIKQTQNA